MAAEAAERHLELLREEREAELAESRYRRAGRPGAGQACWLAPVEPAVTYIAAMGVPVLAGPALTWGKP